MLCKSLILKDNLPFSGSIFEALHSDLFGPVKRFSMPSRGPCRGSLKSRKTHFLTFPGSRRSASRPWHPHRPTQICSRRFEDGVLLAVLRVSAKLLEPPPSPNSSTNIRRMPRSTSKWSQGRQAWRGPELALSASPEREWLAWLALAFLGQCPHFGGGVAAHEVFRQAGLAYRQGTPL